MYSKAIKIICLITLVCIMDGCGGGGGGTEPVTTPPEEPGMGYGGPNCGNGIIDTGEIWVMSPNRCITRGILIYSSHG